MADTRSNRILWLVLGGGALLFLGLSLAAAAFYFADRPGASLALGSSQIAVLDVEGVIDDSTDFVDQLKLYGRLSGVKAVVVRLNSPGGGVAASQEMYEAVKKFRLETKKKVIVSMSSVAASGAYYVACAADRIFANPGSVTGSIGVIAEWYNYGELLKWAKTEPVVIKSGVLKDAGSPTRPLTEAERAYFQTLIDNMYGQFVAAVASGRRMQETAVRALADGRVFTGQEAHRNGLVDELGTLQDAVAAAAKLANLSGEPRTVTPPRKKTSLWDLLFGESRTVLPFGRDRSESHIRFEYLWR